MNLVCCLFLSEAIKTVTVLIQEIPYHKHADVNGWPKWFVILSFSREVQISSPDSSTVERNGILHLHLC